MRLSTQKKKDSLKLLRLALPAMATQISLTLVQLIDTMFIGRLGPLALGASAVTGIIIFNITAVGDGFSTGMVAIADVYDALRSKRYYKEAFSH